MTTFKYDPNNTEGSYPDAMVVEGAELKKGDKIVATDLVDLYDTDINNPQDQQALTYVGDKWINGEVTGGSGCNVFEGYDGVKVYPILNISSGENHTIIVKSDGTLWGTGNNDYGQLGLNNHTNIHIFTQIGTDTDWDIITCGGGHSMAIKTDGTLWATGRNNFGQLGLGDNTDRNVFTQVGTDTDWKYVSCGGFYTVAIKENGTLWATGQNLYGQLGLGDNTDRNVFTQVGSSNDWKQIYCGFNHIISIKTNGTLWGTGTNYYGQLGLGDTITRNIFTQEIGLNNDWEYVTCGYGCTISIKSNGELWGAGINYNGQLGLDNIDYTHYITSFVNIGTDTDWKHVDCHNSFHTMAIKQNGTLWATGSNYWGGLGLGDNIDRNSFTQVGTDTDWDQVSCGFDHTMAIKGSWMMFSTGYNQSGQLGLGDTITRNIFTEVSYMSVYENSLFIEQNTTTPGEGQYDTPFQSLKDAFVWLRNTCAVIPEDITLQVQLLSDLNITEETSLNHPYGHRIVIDGNGFDMIQENNISVDLHYGVGDFDNIMIGSGGDQTLIIKNDGTLWGTGGNANGELGLGDNVNRSIFTQEYLNNHKWIHISCSRYSSLSIQNNGTLWGTGNNYIGQLGLGDNVDRNIFTQEYSRDNNWKYIDCGNRHSLALKTDGTLWCCGFNGRGQLGMGDKTSRDIFTKVDSDNVVDVGGGDLHSLKIKSDGTLWGAGYNRYGQLGIGSDTSTDQISFIQEVSINNNWKRVSCGHYHSIALKTDGTLWGAGQNSIGQLGISGSGNKLEFEQEDMKYNDWIHIDCGFAHTVALRDNGTIWATGQNIYGQLGLGDKIDRENFTQIGDDTDWVYIGCGENHTIAIKSDGTLWCCGFNGRGQLGMSGIHIILTKVTEEKYRITNIDGDEPKLLMYNNNSISTNNISLKNDIIMDDVVGIDIDKQYIRTTCGADFTVSIRDDGTLWVGGANYYGQLGLGHNDNIMHGFIQVGTDTDWKQVGCGFRHTMAIKTDGTLWGTGLNITGGLGLGDNTSRNVFTQVGTDNDYQMVACGYNCTLVIRNDGTLWGTGRNHYGQLGLDDLIDRNVFVKEYTNAKWKYVDSTYVSTMAIRDDGTLWGTGGNYKGQLGINTNTSVKIFTQEVGFDSDWIQVASGNNSSMAVKSDGTLWSTGLNQFGQLGVGDYTERYIFTQEILGNNNWVHAGCFGESLLALDNIGHIYSCGRNLSGETGGNYGHTLLRDVVQMEYITFLEVGGSHSLCIQDGGYIYGTGNGTSGQLGGIGTRNSFAYIDGGITKDGIPIIEYEYDEYDIYVNNFVITNISDLHSNNFNIIKPYNEIKVKELELNTHYAILNFHKTSIEFSSSVGTFEGNIPENITVDMNSTIEIPELEQDITGWKAKNNSAVIINTESNPIIDIENENSTIIVNDAEI